MNASATLSAEGGISVAVAKAGVYCDATLFNGDINFAVGLSLASLPIEGYVSVDFYVEALRI